MRAVLVILAAPLFLGGCAWNPFQMSPGGASLRMTDKGELFYENNGRDIDSANGEVVFPNGARGKFRIVGSRGSASADTATNAQAQLNALLIAMLGEKIPSLGAALRSVPPTP